MSRIANVGIDRLTKGLNDFVFVVVGEFGGMTSIREFKTYSEALKEMAKVAQREELRYESGIDRGFYR